MAAFSEAFYLTEFQHTAWIKAANGWAYNNLNLRFTEQTPRDFLISFNTFSSLSEGISGSSEEYKHLINSTTWLCSLLGLYWGNKLQEALYCNPVVTACIWTLSFNYLPSGYCYIKTNIRSKHHCGGIE